MMSGKKQVVSCGNLLQPFHLLTITLLSLLLPLSFLLLARLSTAQYLLTFTTSQTTPQPLSLLFSLFLYTNPTILHVLVSLVCVATLIHGLTCRITLFIINYEESSWSSSSTPTVRPPRLYTAWILLCTLQVCVGLGIEGSIAAGIDGYTGGLVQVGHERNLVSRIVFFLGLHETMLHWSQLVVKPVVDDTVYGFARELEVGWLERMAMAASFGSLWWWRLRDEVESLVVVAEVKRELSMGVGVTDFVGWWLYYLTVTIGMVRVVKALIWLGIILFCKKRPTPPLQADSQSHWFHIMEEKV
ncbi:uncharacterized protein LOC132268482 [Cornus florida]|uniref:uncharacterized protein LOC132268482 n=1 Tax=Cornus florida TaxID=4283 RepID=UPI0028A2B93F|nr:uncharacterized protein LOC132268482 [Cornus florida]